MSCREIVDNHEKENALNVVTDERTYQIYAESPEDARYTAHWFSLVAAWRRRAHHIEAPL